MPIKLVVCDAFDAQAVALLSARLEALVVRAKDLRPTAEELKDCQGLLIRSRTKVDRHLLEQAPQLRFVVTATSGFDHLDFQECQKRNIVVSHTPEANVTSAAELTILLMLALLRELPESIKKVSLLGWREERLRGHLLEGKTLGIVGLGRIGQRVAKMADAFGMKILAHDPYQDDAVFRSSRADRKSLTELLILSDVVSLHVPLTKQTRHLLNHQTLRVINPEAVVINASRGSVIHENELILALQEGHLRGAALDVFEWEPLAKESKLRECARVLLTPHVGAFTHEALERASLQAVEHTLDFFKKGSCPDCLPLNVPWFDQILRE